MSSTRKVGESIEDFACRLKRAFHKVQTAQKQMGLSQLDDLELQLQFIDSLGDADVGRHLKMRSKADKTLTYLQLIDTAKTLGADVQHTEVYAVTTSPSCSGCKEKDKALEAKDKQLADLSARMDALEARDRRQTAPYGNRQPNRQERETRRCFECHLVGHLARDCRQRRTYQRQASGNDSH